MSFFANRNNNQMGKSITYVASVVSEILTTLEQNVVVGVCGKDLENLAVKIMAERKVKSSSLNYNGFPSAICVSVNHVATHGIPNDYQFTVGDLVSFDVACNFNGFHADAARTVIVKPLREGDQLSEDYKLRERIIKVSHQALIGAIEMIVPNQTTNTDIGNFINSFVEDEGFFVVKEYGGHGIGPQLHTDPFIPNFRNYDKQQGVSSVVVKEGMYLCIEPIIQDGDDLVVTSIDDGWTVYSPHKLLSSHFEHTIFIGSNYVEILTLEKPLKIEKRI